MYTLFPLGLKFECGRLTGCQAQINPLSLGGICLYEWSSLLG